MHFLLPEDFYHQNLFHLIYGMYQLFFEFIKLWCYLFTILIRFKRYLIHRATQLIYCGFFSSKLIHTAYQNEIHVAFKTYESSLILRLRDFYHEKVIKWSPSALTEQSVIISALDLNLIIISGSHIIPRYIHNDCFQLGRTSSL